MSGYSITNSDFFIDEMKSKLDYLSWSIASLIRHVGPTYRPVHQFTSFYIQLHRNASVLALQEMEQRTQLRPLIMQKPIQQIYGT
jgi:hypothetical protein